MAKKKEAEAPAAIAPFVPAQNLPDIKPGDVVAVHLRIVEGDKERIQTFEGTVIAIRGTGAGRTFTVRKVSRGIGVERILPFGSPVISSMEVKRHGRVRRAKLYYLRGLKGRSAQLKEQRVEREPGPQAQTT